MKKPVWIDERDAIALHAGYVTVRITDRSTSTATITLAAAIGPGPPPTAIFLCRGR